MIILDVIKMISMVFNILNTLIAIAILSNYSVFGVLL